MLVCCTQENKRKKNLKGNRIYLKYSVLVDYFAI